MVTCGAKNFGTSPFKDPNPKRWWTFLALARLGGFLHLAFFGHHRDVQQAERQNHHHEYECHGLNVSP